MRRSLPIFFAVLALVIVAAWAWRQAYLLPSLRQIATADLRDPDGAQFRNEAMVSFGLVRHSRYCGEVNVKNAAGGYVGYQPFIVFGGSGRAYIGEDTERSCDQVRSATRWLGVGLFVDLVKHHTSAPEAPARVIPDGAVGALDVDEGRWVFFADASDIGGACRGWNVLAMQTADRPATTDLMCWNEKDGHVYTATREAIGSMRIPVADIQ